ncbi:MAG TPA: class I SAM-dependent methyltransferase [Verrucomicrobiae bacterium]|nr:class I SAM-dependent methyltransferase [Verrucomicrobiae bacterium]
MPSSRPNTIPTVIHLVRQLKPKSILDVGIGFGKWGHLFREYTDINEAEREPDRYQRANWKVRIDGIEGNASYVTGMHRYLYNNIYIGNAGDWLKKLPHYDLVFLGDVIEHLEKPAGHSLLREATQKARKAVVITTPKFETGQADLCDNELERHRSLWTGRDFREFEGAIVKTIDSSILLAVLLKPGVAIPVFGPPKPTKPADVRRLQRCQAKLIKLIPLTEPFILVDEEQFRSDLPHTRAIPFLERDGQYWGPPADDETAIREFERLRTSGARLIAFAWPSFWWLEHYREFHEHLRKRFRRVLKDDSLVVFRLRA